MTAAQAHELTLKSVNNVQKITDQLMDVNKKIKDAAENGSLSVTLFGLFDVVRAKLILDGYNITIGGESASMGIRFNVSW